ncbi:MAG: 50S ribosomal protein L1 [Candidatus Altiarchaeum hamiconexum]|uniref:50S ribosomal protein L1 n=1 Tax=Candidatus Altarchaeum hamiconexum TaxID=1803513 RepID=A0A8J7YS47_9ARCH|nr:50S ribosomal protein L1 [Candidatus Altarchaeum hamiconexum]OIQ05468.1 MAG: 50S ribosomal protein L1 [Candidatus Altarchaeum sp. CG2_30_32_3053]PIN67950.1 MAG: 50S ribosomal protein L1 [Candidatus Altarchaeum sp. CG12_big_fil_rev_8_21_14_0_65_33_22]PIV27166.1 MAG: 50S ribosomal protein L1 [Candidatus Altarchaeum sp. CG03_land_8_20_14_0_80_32_618]PIX49360.1 MAG: 50S ribosomal protein L1 [Candidatus Altarchaeum sp. CG_4_8_14_3_um_filter_33_2054]PIZ31924.1 MAG: 50S ribosomal protein L1 [Candi
MVEKEKKINVAEKFKEMIEKSSKRDFVQSVDMAVKFRDIDFKKPENKINLIIALPKGPGKEQTVGIFAEGDGLVEAKKITDKVFGKNDINGLKDSKRKLRKIANECAFFMSQQDLMGLIGKTWGTILGPRGKIPQILLPNAPIAPIFERLKRSICVVSKKGRVVYAKIGNEKMPADDLIANYNTVVENIAEKVDKKKIAAIYIKTTMGRSVRTQ